MSASIGKVTLSMNKLNVSANAAGEPKSNKTEVADSWEDEADESSGTEVGTTESVRLRTSDLPGAPPPTPVSPLPSPGKSTPYSPGTTFSYDGPFDQPSSAAAPNTSSAGLERRPEKSTAVAARLIAAGIGQRAPKRTQEQRDYDRSVKLQEKRKRDQAKEAEEKKKRDKEQAQRDVWGD